YGCGGLTSVTIGKSVTSFGSSAFCFCSSLTSITNYAVSPQSIEGNVFSGGVNINNCKLYVWHESLDAYKAANIWKDFDIQDMSGIDGVEVDEAAKEVEGYYDLKGVRLEEPARGQVNIVRYKDGSSQKVVIK
ncbi:MAG: leucine-rich repeat protein, partial [Muribaculaceae bacterium]|nr:leucine-rich repeat protein [Muribaculaceae bacterium]